MITFALNTFIKICLLDTGGRISEIQKRLEGKGGYDFYKPLQQAVRAHCDGYPQKAADILNRPHNATERKYNQEAFDSFNQKFGSIRSLQAVKQSASVQFRAAGITIKVDPLFEHVKSGSQNVYSLWATQQPSLTQKYGAVACHIQRLAYANSSLGNSSFHFADLVENRTYSEKQITNNTNLILMADVNSIGTLLKQL
ncbi:MAG: hypothetical protein AAF754_07990 [Pseudomonadota bacterium]